MTMKVVEKPWRRPRAYRPIGLSRKDRNDFCRQKQFALQSAAALFFGEISQKF